MAAGALAMSGRERERLIVIAQVCGKVLSQGAAAERLGICVRQVKRLVRAYRGEGDAGLVSRQRGRASNRRLAPGVGERTSELLGGKYRDFGPTLACEKLAELEGILVSRETIRRLQIRLGLWKPKRRRHKRVFQLRERRPRFGELIQIDGSPHDWFEGRGPRCTLIVFIDDATGRLTALRFAPAETTRAYLGALRDHVLAHGCPAAFYSDRHGIFRVNAKDAASGDGKTEFGRVSERLRIELINALTPQAKGRVERANQTLQDRLVREMRLRGISSIEEAQAFTPAFIAAWNEKFAVPPREETHRPGQGRRPRRPSSLDQGRRCARGGAGAARGARPVQSPDLQRRRRRPLRQDQRPRHRHARGQDNPAALARRLHAAALQGPRPAIHASQILAPAKPRRR